MKEEEGENASIITNYWTFNDDGTMEAKQAIKVEEREESFEIFGTYAVSGSDYTLTITATVATNFLGSFSSSVEEEITGTWSSKGNTLTLSSDAGTITVLQRNGTQ